jgi:hypothetical protein
MKVLIFPDACHPIVKDQEAMLEYGGLAAITSG